MLKRHVLNLLRSRLIRYALLSSLVSLIALACSQGTISETAVEPDAASREELVILWDKGYVIEEDEAIEAVVRDWQNQSGLAVDLSFYNSGEIAPKTLRASQAGAPPDILFAAKSVYPVTDWQGKLADVSEVVDGMRDLYTADALQAAKIYGSTEPNDYGVPLSQSTTHIFYWKDLLQEAGYTPADIPTDWDGFWNFWKTVQDQLRPQYPDLYSIGLPYSAVATDTYQIFEQVLEAYDVEMLDEQGQLQVDRPEVRQGIVQSLDWYLQFYREGYAPPDAASWSDPENNRHLLNRNLVMTPNPTLSIPAAVRNDQELYTQRLGTIEFPQKPSGNPMPHLVIVRQAIVFEDSPNQAAAKDFLAYLIQPEVLNSFLKTSYGRFMPVTQQFGADEFWSDPQDPHISTVTETLDRGLTRSFYNTLNPAYGVVMEENIWGQVIQEMAANNLSAEAAADQAIDQIQAIFEQAS
ncbi:carbohydrate ABC transporter substrate-binding protein [Romeria aff. gracilis LEGE 07310]|uniref:Carbohydrate ABC transporter substrate-binding protein n=1 Tax=Vasconcelosia minhoensis LEGE 07310 TaxID=915328 RepID=A0A8J7DBE1_9CYAN|nr:ABC transporter substrate-binding protein [Romeria gracilis]MBE9076283.1 carbohydrate ABC transporter substrate-binding protein [Romeria aff. gracilis LEGE 07310]